MAPGIQVALSLVMAFGVPLIFAIGERGTTKRDKGDWNGRNDPPEPRPSPRPSSDETMSRPLPACLIPVVVQKAPAMSEPASSQRVLEPA